jgi:uridine kinase
VDDFHRPASERYRRGRYSAESFYFDAFDYPAVREHLLVPLGPGGSRQYRSAHYDAWNDRPIEQPQQQAPADAILLVDGIFLCRPELDDLWDARVFVDVDPEESVRRGVLRDRTWMGSEEEARKRYQERYLPGEQLYVQAVQPHLLANAIVDNRDPARPGLTLQDGARVKRPVKRKAFAYMTHRHPELGERLLVFSHPNAPEAGIQVPAGTIRPGESPEEAVLREAYEETGLENLEIVGFLGERFRHATNLGRDEIHQRFFFHLRCSGSPPAVWRHYEPDPDDGSEPPLFELFWARLPDEVPTLVAEHEALLPALMASLGSDTDLSTPTDLGDSDTRRTDG